ncbi:threonine/homoserine/homoserine lactone efflux protein [Agromyces terreus]|uniref:Threonine/homoserine/homoserine lactone efflux protein n=1 Tax=Agromyces terreus TaxID=424795 RepID=A0A9X2H7U3_9MICO|nr:GAP family protein [Agromyces terreus]MCP2371554.1 threonine/homoserine/homoserine lactone efflux protein [Agromyces terreus]
MNGAIGGILPLALGVAISPVPIIAAILMLLSPKARVTSVGFLLGWLVGIIVAVSVFTALAAVLPEEDPGASKPIQGVIQLVLGLLLLVLAVGQWRKRPKKGEEPVLPKWMQAIDKISFFGAFGLGFLLSALNPKNLIMAAGAGTAIGAAQLTGGGIVLVIAIYVVIAASTVAIPVIAYLIAADKLRGPLDALRVWLAQENALIMAVLLLVIGVSMLGKGIGSF